MAKTFIMPVRLHNDLVASAYRHRGYNADESAAAARFSEITAWHGIKMVSEANTTYMDSLTDVFPAYRKGPQGDVLKVNCATCHNGINKPLYGFSMKTNYPELSVPNP